MKAFTAPSVRRRNEWCSGDKEQFAGVRGAFSSPERPLERLRGAPDDDKYFEKFHFFKKKTPNFSDFVSHIFKI